MAMKKLGVVLIGQSPRDDLMQQLRDTLGEGVEIEMRGALDGLSTEEIAAIPPRGDDDTLIEFLPPERRGNTPDKAGRLISKELVEERALSVIEGLHRDGYPVSMLFCAGDFPGIIFHGLFVLPSAVLDHLVGAIFQNGKLGVFMPLAEQCSHFEARWRAEGREVFGVPLLPGADQQIVEAAARQMATHEPDLIIMDCLGYTKSLKQQLDATLKTPKVVAFDYVASVLNILI